MTRKSDNTCTYNLQDYVLTLAEYMIFFEQDPAKDNGWFAYYRLKFELLDKFFHLTGPCTSRGKLKLPGLLGEAIQCYNAIPEFMGGFLLYTPLQGEKQITLNIGPQIYEETEILKQVYLELIEKLILNYNPSLATLRIEKQFLIDLGLPAIEPDPIDYI